MENGEPVGGYDIFPRTNDRSFDSHNDTTNRVAVMGRGGVFTFFTNGTWVGEVDLNEPPPKPATPPKPQIPDDQSNNEQMEQYRAQLEEYENPIFEEGFLGLALASESGETTCHFENAWLWIIEE